MGAPLNDLSAVQHQDLIRIADRLQPVSDHQNGLVPSQGFNGLLQPVLILRVYIGGGFIQNHDGSILQDSPGDGDSLLLAAGKTGATFADDGVIALGQGENEVVATGFLRRSHHFLVGGIGASKLDVIFHRVGKEIDLLKYHGDLIHQVLQSIVLHILTAHKDGAALHIPEPGDEITQCGFPGTAGAHDGGGGSVRDGEGYIPQDRPLVIRERNMVEGNAVLPGRAGPTGLCQLGHGVRLIGMGHAAADDTQQGHAAARRGDLSKDQEGHDDHHQGVGQDHGPGEIEPYR